MDILDKITSGEDVRRLDEAELAPLCEELRRFVVESVARTGGHLSSNLGVVELTVAIHRVFNTKRDRLLFDVGHQCYIHKILTGRREAFGTLRSLDGISGFPKPGEAVDDAFVAGHASSAISTALGMARARTLLGEDYAVIAVVGDGALTGGLSYEALCDAGASDEPLVVILNDNGMSITKNVGAMARYLSRLRLKDGYIAFKNGFRWLTRRVPGGKWVYKMAHKVKKTIKEAIFPCSMFENMGFAYLGPVDGHNLKSVIQALKVAREAREPVLVHVITQKGKGYPYAEANPDAFHGVPPFDAAGGVIPAPREGFSDVFGRELVRLAGEDERLCAITAAMPSGTGLAEFAKKYPERFFDVGICEGHAAAMAGGMAHRGLVPVFAVYSTFLQRSYDMLLQDIALGGEHVVLCVDRAGISGEDGETHQGSMDVSYLTSIPNMTVWSPAGFPELRDMLDYAVEKETGPVAVRYPKGPAGCWNVGGAEASFLVRHGDDFTLVTYGITVTAAIGASVILRREGVRIDLLKLGRLKPLDFGPIEESVRKTGRLLVAEESVQAGGVGEHIAAHLAEAGIPVKTLILKNLGDAFLPQGTQEELRRLCGLDHESLAAAILDALKGGDDRGEDKT